MAPARLENLLCLLAVALSLSLLVVANGPAGFTPHFDYLEAPVGHLKPTEHEWAQHLRWGRSGKSVRGQGLRWHVHAGTMGNDEGPTLAWKGR